MRVSAAIGLLSLGCGGRTVLLTSEALSEPSDGGLSDATADGRNDAPDALARAPIPSCAGANSQCVRDDATGRLRGAAIVRCEGVYFVGYLALLLERQDNGQFRTVLKQTTDTPGFGLTLEDTDAPLTRITYRVCVADDEGTRCGEPFTTEGPPNCVCQPLTCAFVRACDTHLDNGCGSRLECGGCPNGAICNDDTRSCCPPGEEADGTGGCACAPPRPCPPRSYWDEGLCACAPIN